MPHGIHKKRAIVLSPLIKYVFINTLFSTITFFSSVMAVFAAELKSFTLSSFDRIEATYQGQPFMVAVWSIDCPPCMRELKILAKLKQEYPNFNLVLISTDGLNNERQVKDLLASYSLVDGDSWIFSADQPERLRYSIDSDWYGEIPRSYRYSNGVRKTTSGLIGEKELRSWIINSYQEI